MIRPVVVVDPEMQSGAPVFAGTRAPIRNLFDYLEEGDSLDVFLDQFPSVSREMAVAVLERARFLLLQPPGSTFLSPPTGTSSFNRIWQPCR